MVEKLSLKYYRHGKGASFHNSLVFDTYEEVEKYVKENIFKLIRDSGTYMISIYIEKHKG